MLLTCLDPAFYFHVVFQVSPALLSWIFTFFIFLFSPTLGQGGTCACSVSLFVCTGKTCRAKRCAVLLIFTVRPCRSCGPCSRSAPLACLWPRLLLLALDCMPVGRSVWFSYRLGIVANRYRMYLKLPAPNRQIGEVRLCTRILVCLM